MNDNTFESLNKEVQNLSASLEKIEREIRNLKKGISNLHDATKKDYSKVPGVEGVFDGFFLITTTGEKHEVPMNYSAKSRLVFGDILKLVEEDGKKLFKQINKVPRKEFEGVVNKKDGKWHVITEAGSFRLNDAAVEFNKLELNDKIVVSIPENPTGANYAALETVLTQKEQVKKAPVQTNNPQIKADTKKADKPINSLKKPALAPSKPAPKPAPRKETKTPAPAPKRPIEPKPLPEKPVVKPQEPGENITDILSDDLV